MDQDSPEYKPVSQLNFFRDDFFRTDDGSALVGPKDLLKSIRDHPIDNLNPETMEAVDHYWLHESYSYAVIIYSHSESEYQYWCVEPHLNHAERKQMDYLEHKVRTVAEDQEVLQADNEELGELIQNILFDLVQRYDLADEEVLDQTAEIAEFQPHTTVQSDDEELSGVRDRLMTALSRWLESLSTKQQTDDSDDLEKDDFSATYSPKQVDKITYYLIRDIVGNNKINPLSHDLHIEDISCDGYHEPVFVHHTQHEEVWTNIRFGKEELDGFIKHLAQSSGKGISKRDPVVDVELDDGSRANLTLGKEVTTKGSNFTIRQFKPVPFTPVDLINWETYSLEQMTYLWHAIEFGKNAIFAGGTASGKTTTLNAVSLFIPSKTKIVSIEDTPELKLPHKNWVQSETRSGGRGGSRDAFAEFDLLKQSFRQRPSYIVLGEVRGDEGRTLFQAMSSGHTAFTTFHANNANELVHRFTGDQIGVDTPAFEQLDIVCTQEQRRVDGNKVRRSTQIKEVLGYDKTEDDVEFRDMYTWNPDGDNFNAAEHSKILSEIRERNGWTGGKFTREFRKRKVVLAYLVREGYTDYSQVAGTLQAFMNDPDTILHYISTDKLGDFLEQLRSMKSIEIQVDPEIEERVSRPKPSAEVLDEAKSVLDNAEGILQEYRHMDVGSAFRHNGTPFGEEKSVLEQAQEAGYEIETDAEASDVVEDGIQAAETADAEDGQEETVSDDEPAILEDTDVEMELDGGDQETTIGQERPNGMDGDDTLDAADDGKSPDTTDVPKSGQTKSQVDDVATSSDNSLSTEASDRTDNDTTPTDAADTNERNLSPPSTVSDTQKSAGDNSPEDKADEEPLPDLTPPDHPDRTVGSTAEEESESDESDSLTAIEMYMQQRGLASGDLPFEFDQNDCHYIIGKDEGDKGQGVRQCQAPISDGDKFCHIHEDKSQDITDIEAAIASVAVDRGSK